MHSSPSLRMISFVVITLGLGLTIVCAAPVRQPPPANAPASITVEISSPEHFRRRVLAIDQGFLVVVNNVSAAPVRVWRDWCSWGYQQLSFEITDDAGHSWTVRRKEHEFFKNYPDYWTLGPGEPLVLSIALTTDLWESPESGGGLPIADRCEDFPGVSALNVEPLIGNLMPRQELAYFIAARRPSSPDHSNSFKWRAVRCRPLIQQIVEHRIQILIKARNEVRRSRIRHVSTDGIPQFRKVLTGRLIKVREGRRLE